MIVSPLIFGYRTEAVGMIDSTTNTAITAPVKRLNQRPLVHGPSTALSLHSGSRKTVALGSSTPASVWTALVNSPSGVPGARTSAAANPMRPQ